MTTGNRFHVAIVAILAVLGSSLANKTKVIQLMNIH